MVGKRYAEAKGASVRAVLKQYSERYLFGLLLVSAALVLVSYGVYTILGVATEPLLVYSNLFVIGGIFKYLQILLKSDNGEFPERMLVKDPVMLSIVVGWIGFISYVFYA